YSRRVFDLEIAVRGEPGRFGVRLEDAARMRGADHHALIDLESDREEFPTGLLLEDIVIRLDTTEIVLAHRGAALFETSRPRTECDAVVANLPLRPERFERLPAGRIPDRGRARIGELEHIDDGRSEPIPRLPHGRPNPGAE